MQKLGRKSFLGSAAAILAVACLGIASWGSHKSSERETNVNFINMTKFANGDTLKAGTYQMEVPKNTQTPEVTFYKNGKAVATVHAKVVTQPKKNENTEVDSVTQGKTDLVTAIRPAGWEEELIFRSGGQHGPAHSGQ